MKKHKIHTTKVHPTLQLLLAIALFIIATMASRGSSIDPWESELFLAIYELPRFLFYFFIVITQFGSIYVLGLLLLLYLVKRHYHIVLRLLLTGTLAYTVSGLAKDMWGRGRPAELIPDVVSLDFIVRGPGFPSGHTALATALALTLGYHLAKRHWWIVPFLITGVGLSRMYLGVHTPLDIVGGFAIGWGCYALYRHVRLSDITLKRKSREKQSITPPRRRVRARA